MGIHLQLKLSDLYSSLFVIGSSYFSKINFVVVGVSEKSQNIQQRLKMACSSDDKVDETTFDSVACCTQGQNDTPPMCLPEMSAKLYHP